MSTCDCSREARRDARLDVEIVVAGVAFAGRLPGWTCRDCGEQTVDPEAHAALEHAAGLALCRRGYRSGEALRHCRLCLGWRGTDLAEALGVSPETVSRWERGHLDVPPYVAVIVGCLLEDLDRTYRLLAAQHEPPIAHTTPIFLGDLLTST